MRGSLAALALALAACGYKPIAGAAGAGGERLHVVLASSNVPDAIASDEVVAGVRDELARAGALAAGDGYPRCEVEVLRADEAAAKAAALADPKVQEFTKDKTVKKVIYVKGRILNLIVE